MCVYRLSIDTTACLPAYVSFPFSPSLSLSHCCSTYSKLIFGSVSHDGFIDDKWFSFFTFFLLVGAAPQLENVLRVGVCVCVRESFLFFSILKQNILKPHTAHPWEVGKIFILFIAARKTIDSSGIPSVQNMPHYTLVCVCVCVRACLTVASGSERANAP